MGLVLLCACGFNVRTEVTNQATQERDGLHGVFPQYLFQACERMEAARILPDDLQCVPFIEALLDLGQIRNFPGLVAVGITVEPLDQVGGRQARQIGLTQVLGGGQTSVASHCGLRHTHSVSDLPIGQRGGEHQADGVVDFHSDKLLSPARSQPPVAVSGKGG